MRVRISLLARTRFVQTRHIDIQLGFALSIRIAISTPGSSLAVMFRNKGKADGRTKCLRRSLMVAVAVIAMVGLEMDG
jgi:hypothetical protein